MSERTLVVTGAIVFLYLYMRSRAQSAVTVGTVVRSTTPQTQVSQPAGTSAQGATGTGLVMAPIASVGSLNAANNVRRAPGTRPASYRLSSSWKGFGTAGITPTWPTNQVTPTQQINISSGAVQVPSYTAVPLVIRGPGGGGSVLNFGGAW
jgi:hypothetical protein